MATVVGCASVVISGLASLAAPGIVRRAVDSLGAGAPISSIWRYAGLLVVVAVVSGFFQFRFGALVTRPCLSAAAETRM